MAGEYAAFQVGHVHLGVPVEAVREVLRTHPLTPVPLASREVVGLLNLRGQVVTALSARRLLHLPDDDRSDHLNVVVDTPQGPVSLQVDAFDEVVVVDDDLHEAPPPTLSEELRGIITGACRLPGRLLLTIDVARAAAGNQR